MAIQPIRYGLLISQDQQRMLEHSIVVNRYYGMIQICQGDNFINVTDDGLKEFLKACREVAPEEA